MLPPSKQLDAAAVELYRRGDRRTLICLVERWAQLGQPTARARLLQIRAFLQLGLMDRAWARLQELAAFGDHPLDRLKLTAQMFIERGWPQRAQEPLAEARKLMPEGVADPELDLLDARAREPARRAPSFDPPPQQDLETALEAARLFLCTGAFIRARRLLDTLQRRAPQDRRVLDLLWGLQGDYELHGASLPAIVDRYAPAAQAAASLRSGQGPSTPNTDDTRAVSGLFRDATTLTDDDPETEAETTQATRLDRLDAPQHRSDDDLAEETQVLRVIQSRRGPTRDSVVAGAEPPAELEEEDDALVVLTRHRDAPPAPQMIEPLPLPALAERRQKRKRESRQPAAAASPPEALPDAALDDLPPADSAPDSVAATPSAPGWLVATMLVLALAGLGGAAAMLWLAANL